MNKDAMSLVRRALRHFNHNTTDQADSTMEISLSAYRDEKRYGLEIERVFKHLPIAVALSIELPDAGSYRAMTVLGVSSPRGKTLRRGCRQVTLDCLSLSRLEL